MELVFAVDVISRIVHVGTAICLAGGSVYTLFVLLPALRAIDDVARQNMLAGVGRYWKRFVHGGTAFLLLTGFYNYFVQMKLHKGDGLYHALIGIKMLLAFAVFFLAAVLVGKSPRFQSMRDNRARYLGLVVLMIAIIVAISGILKVRGVPADVVLKQQVADPAPAMVEATPQ